MPSCTNLGTCYPITFTFQSVHQLDRAVSRSTSCAVASFVAKKATWDLDQASRYVLRVFIIKDVQLDTPFHSESQALVSGFPKTSRWGNFVFLPLWGGQFLPYVAWPLLPIPTAGRVLGRTARLQDLRTSRFAKVTADIRACCMYSNLSVSRANFKSSPEVHNVLAKKYWSVTHSKGIIIVYLTPLLPSGLSRSPRQAIHDKQMQNAGITLRFSCAYCSVMFYSVMWQ